jgi:hypothetical protein
MNNEATISGYPTTALPVLIAGGGPAGMTAALASPNSLELASPNSLELASPNSLELASAIAAN